MNADEVLNQIIKNEPKGRGASAEDRRTSYYRGQIAHMVRELMKANQAAHPGEGKSPVETPDFLVSKGNTFTNVRLTLLKMYMDGGKAPTEDEFEKHFALVIKPMLEMHEEIKEEHALKAAAKPTAKVSTLIGV